MPLDSELPVIDNRSFDDIEAEIKSRVVRYTQEWKPVWDDVNDTDPGVTLAQVVAWIGEMLIYRLNLVPKLNYVKFLQLLGVELNPATPALAKITFPLSKESSEPYIIVPLRTQVSADPGDGGRPVVFETTRAFVALKAELAAVQVLKGDRCTSKTDENDEAEQGFEPFSIEPDEGNALLLGFRYEGEFPQVDIDLTVWSMEEVSGLMAFDCGLPETKLYTSADIVWEYFDGFEWSRMETLKDETMSFTRTGHIILKSPPSGKMKSAAVEEIGAAVEEIAESLYWIRARLERSRYERPPRILAIRSNTVSAEQAETVIGEVLGGTDGLPAQKLRLENAPVLKGSLELLIDEGRGEENWIEKEDLFGSKPDEKHFRLNRTTGEVIFGDGIHHGHIPAKNANNPGANVRAGVYRFGGGKRGNVPEGTINSILTPLPGINTGGIYNLRPAHSGRDDEIFEEAKQRVQRSLKSKCRAVTAGDFETLAMQASNIKRAKALPLYHPDFPNTKVPGVITVIVVPDSDDPKPMPSEGTLRTVCEYLNQRRLLTIEVYVVRPTYKKVEVSGVVYAQNDADLAEVRRNIEQSLFTYFHPLVGADNEKGWKFGDNIYYSRVYQRIFSVSGVERIEEFTIRVDGEKYGECEDVEIDEGVLLYSTVADHNVQIRYAFDE